MYKWNLFWGFQAKSLSVHRQAGFEDISLASASQVLGLKACTATPSSKVFVITFIFIKFSIAFLPYLSQMPIILIVGFTCKLVIHFEVMFL